MTAWGNRDGRTGQIEWYYVKEDEEIFSRHNTDIGVNFD
jgi:ATP-dependent RNA helicase DDX3X